jgi:hypothetical protein
MTSQWRVPSTSGSLPPTREEEDDVFIRNSEKGLTLQGFIPASPSPTKEKMPDSAIGTGIGISGWLTDCNQASNRNYPEQG